MAFTPCTAGSWAGNGTVVGGIGMAAVALLDGTALLCGGYGPSGMGQGTRARAPAPGRHATGSVSEGGNALAGGLHTTSSRHRKAARPCQLSISGCVMVHECGVRCRCRSVALNRCEPWRICQEAGAGVSGSRATLGDPAHSPGHDHECAKRQHAIQHQVAAHASAGSGQNADCHDSQQIHHVSVLAGRFSRASSRPMP